MLQFEGPISTLLLLHQLLPRVLHEPPWEQSGMTGLHPLLFTIHLQPSSGAACSSCSTTLEIYFWLKSRSSTTPNNSVLRRSHGTKRKTWKAEEGTGMTSWRRVSKATGDTSKKCLPGARGMRFPKVGSSNHNKLKIPSCLLSQSKLCHHSVERPCLDIQPWQAINQSAVNISSPSLVSVIYSFPTFSSHFTRFSFSFPPQKSHFLCFENWYKKIHLWANISHNDVYIHGWRGEGKIHFFKKQNLLLTDPKLCYTSPVVLKVCFHSNIMWHSSLPI